MKRGDMRRALNALDDDMRRARRDADAKMRALSIGLFALAVLVAAVVLVVGW